MSSDESGRAGIVGRMSAATRAGPKEEPVRISPDEARGMIDAVLSAYGIDPEASTDEVGWRHTPLGSAEGQVCVVEAVPGVHYLVAQVPVLELPDDATHLSDFYRLLLWLNHDRTLSAHFSLRDGTIYAVVARTIRALDESAVHQALRTLVTIAERFGPRLRSELDRFLRLKHRDKLQLPNIRMTPKEADTIAGHLALCDEHDRDILRYVMELWQRRGYTLDPRPGSVGLNFPLGDKDYNLGAISPPQYSRPSLFILSWEGLRTQNPFPGDAIDKYQSKVARIAELKVTETTAHITIDEDFTRDDVKALLRGMYALVRSARPELAAEEQFAWCDDLPEMDISVGPKSLTRIAETLRECEPRVQQLYATLIEGWNQAGGTVLCNRVGRIYLKFKTLEQTLPGHGTAAHNFNLAVLAAPKGKRGPSIDIAWNTATSLYPYLDYVAEDVARFEEAVSALPGFQQQGAVTRLLVDDAFRSEHAKHLLDAMLALRTAGADLG